jgi:antitoxin YefM
MYTIYKLRADELDERFLEAVRHQYRNRNIEIVVCEAADSAEDVTAYLLRSPPNRERLLKAIENVAQGRNLVAVERDDLSERVNL